MPIVRRFAGHRTGCEAQVAQIDDSKLYAVVAASTFFLIHRVEKSYQDLYTCQSHTHTHRVRTEKKMAEEENGTFVLNRFIVLNDLRNP